MKIYNENENGSDKNRMLDTNRFDIQIVITCELVSPLQIVQKRRNERRFRMDVFELVWASNIWEKLPFCICFCIPLSCTVLQANDFTSFQFFAIYINLSLWSSYSNSFMKYPVIFKRSHERFFAYKCPKATVDSPFSAGFQRVLSIVRMRAHGRETRTSLSENM